MADADLGWLVPDHLNAKRDALTVSVHSWLVRDAGRVVLVDTGIGAGKNRPFPLFDRRNEPFLERPAAAGAGPDDITHVLLTHVHTDHVGWNTILQDGRWVPTFRKARYLIPEAGVSYFESAEGRLKPNHGMFVGSVLSVIDAGQAVLVPEAGGEALEGFTYHPTPDHSADHMSILLRSGDQKALLAGDVFHHPVQLRRPEWCSVFCADPVQSTNSRRWVLDFAADREIPIFSSHVSGPSAGIVKRHGSAYR